MAETIEQLESKRASLLKELSQTGDMRRGSITEAFRCCGKANCACAGEGHPGHGPFYAFTRKIDGRTQTLQLRPGARLTKLEQEVKTYQEFRRNCQELLEVNETICELRPVEEPEESAERRTLRKKLRKPSNRRSRKKSSA